MVAQLVDMIIIKKKPARWRSGRFWRKCAGCYCTLGFIQL